VKTIAALGAASAAVYDSSDPTSIDKVFTAVVSNF
jgi:hypothetical protein